MEEIITQTPKANEFLIAEHNGYAATSIEACEAMKYLMTKLEPVRLQELEPEDQDCAVCQQEYCVSKNPKLSHPPVKLACGHVFGKPCIIKWLDPLCCWGLKGDADPKIESTSDALIERAKTSCPACRRVLFPEPSREPMDLLAMRLRLWDEAYTTIGVARSEKEERSREYIWEYVNYCLSINEFEISYPLQVEMSIRARAFLVYFTIILENQALTPVQKDLRDRLEVLAMLALLNILEDSLSPKLAPTPYIASDP